MTEVARIEYRHAVSGYTCSEEPNLNVDCRCLLGRLHLCYTICRVYEALKLLGATQFRGRGKMQLIPAAESDLLKIESAAVRKGGISKPMRLYTRPKGVQGVSQPCLHRYES